MTTFWIVVAVLFIFVVLWFVFGACVIGKGLIDFFHNMNTYKYGRDV